MKIGRKIKELRLARGITQEQLANAVGISFQAVSKWENEVTLPDIALAPTLANYFGVSMDELFDYCAEKTADEVSRIAKTTWPLRRSDPEKGKRILYDALKRYPENDILLQNLLYLENYTDNPDKTIEIALRTIDATNDAAVKYDAFRFLAYAYKAKGETDNARAALRQIPDLTFSRLSETANVLTGEEKRNAAEMQRGASLELLFEMQLRIAEDLIEKGQISEAEKEYARIPRLLDALDAANDNCWNSWRECSARKIRELQAR